MSDQPEQPTPESTSELTPAQAQEVQVVESEDQPPLLATDSLVEAWWDEHVKGSVVGRSTEIWNHLQVAKEALKTKLRGLVP